MVIGSSKIDLARITSEIPPKSGKSALSLTLLTSFARSC
jgi:hypothetical protein